MGRPKTDIVTKLRQEIIQLSSEDLDMLVRDIEIIQEIREEIHLKAVENGDFAK